MNPWVVGIAIGYLALSLVVGLWPAKNASASAAGYVAGDRTLGLLLMYFITGATVFSAFAFLGAPGWAYQRGAAAFYILGYGALGLVPFYWMGPKAARLGRELGVVTQAHLVAARLRLPIIAFVMATISMLAFVPYLALQMKGAGYVVEAVTQGTVPSWAGALIVYSVVLAYVLKSGVLGVGWTNTLQGVFMMVLAWCLGLYLPYTVYGGVEQMFERIAVERPELLLAPGLASNGDAWSWGEYSSAILISALGFSMWPHIFMKAFTAKDERTIKRTVLLYPTFQIFLIPLFFIGFAGVLFHSAPQQADQILPHMLLQLELHPAVVGLFCAGALAASMSSGDAIAHAAASIGIRDGWVVAFGKTLAPEVERRCIRIGVVAIVACSYGLAVWYTGSLVTLLLTAYGGIVQFAPLVLVALYAPRTHAHLALLAALLGTAVTGLMILAPELRPWPYHAGIYGLAVNLAVMFVAVCAQNRADWHKLSADRKTVG